MVLKSVSPGILVGVPAKVRQNEESRFAGVFRLALDRLPDLRAQTVGAPDAFNVERVCSGMGDINIVQSDPQKAGRYLPHQLTHDIDREFVGARQRQRMSLEIIYRESQYLLELPQLKLTASELRSVVRRRLIVVSQQMFVVAVAASQGRAQQMLRQNYSSSEPRAIRTVAAFSDPVESIAGSNHPRVGGGAFQVFPEVLKHRRVLRRQGRKIVDRLVDASGQACGRHVVTQDSPVHHLREEGRLRDKFAHQVGDILLPFRSERLLISRAAAEGDDHYLPLVLDSSPCERAWAKQRAPQRQSGSAAQKITPVAGEVPGKFLRRKALSRKSPSPASCNRW